MSPAKAGFGAGFVPDEDGFGWIDMGWDGLGWIGMDWMR